MAFNKEVLITGTMLILKIVIQQTQGEEGKVNRIQVPIHDV